MSTLHPREENVRRAEIAIDKAVSEIIGREKLTTAETIRVLVHTLGDRLASIAKFAIRLERHGDADKPGGVE